MLTVFGQGTEMSDAGLGYKRGPWPSGALGHSSRGTAATQLHLVLLPGEKMALHCQIVLFFKRN